MSQSIAKSRERQDAGEQIDSRALHLICEAVIRWRDRWLMHLAFFFVVSVISGIQSLIGFTVARLLSGYASWPAASLKPLLLGSATGTIVGILMGRECIRWAKTRVIENLFYPERLEGRRGRYDLPASGVPIMTVLYMLDMKGSIPAVHEFVNVVFPFMIGTLMFWLMRYERCHGPVYIVDPDPPRGLG